MFESFEKLPLALREKIAQEKSGCWEWLGYVRKNGYGQTRLKGDPLPWLVHRLVFKLLGGNFILGFDLDHLCRNKLCCNPNHLDQVSHRENCLRGESPWADRAKQTHCKRGHEFTPENIYSPPSKPTTRSCRICMQMHAKTANILRREGYYD